MKKIIILMGLLIFSITNAQNLKYPNVGVGINDLGIDFGISAKANLTEKHTVQLILSPSGDASSYIFRYLHNFKEKEIVNNFAIKPNLYLYSGYFKVNKDLVTENEKNSGIGVGFGGGVEFPSFILDRLRMSVDLGYVFVNVGGYYQNEIQFGGGLHYYFNL